MAAVTQIQVRCATCNRRLADLVNEIRDGQVFFELKCPRCGNPHIEVVRPSQPRKSDDPAQDTHVSKVKRGPGKRPAGPPAPGDRTSVAHALGL